jgi:hypothetical protein
MGTPYIRRFTGQCRSTGRQIQAWWWPNEPKHVVRNDECMVCPCYPLWRRNNREKNFKIFLGRHTRKYTHLAQIRLLFLTSPSRSNLLTNQPICSGHRVCWQTSAEDKSLNSRRHMSWKQAAHAYFWEVRIREFGCTYIHINLSNWPGYELFVFPWLGFGIRISVVLNWQQKPR